MNSKVKLLNLHDEKESDYNNCLQVMLIIKEEKTKKLRILEVL